MRKWMLIVWFIVCISLGQQTSAKEMGCQNDLSLPDANYDKASNNLAYTVTLTQEKKPYIPEKPIKENLVKNAEVVYRITYQVVAKTKSGKVLTNIPISSVQTAGPVVGKRVKAIDKTGKGQIELDVRGAHKIYLQCKLYNQPVTSKQISFIPPLKSTYEEKFFITAYNTPLESDYKAELIEASGIKGTKFRKEFLAQTKLNGTGKAISGKYITYDARSEQFSYVKNPQTATGTPAIVGKTIAVDPYFIPRAKVNGVWKRATVSISGIGKRRAEDGGQAILNYHIDVYKGEGKKAMSNWNNMHSKVTLESVN